MQWCCEAITQAREAGHRKLLINTVLVTGFPPPSTVQRYALGEACAAAGRSAVQVAMVARPEMIDPDRFGMIVARNRGLFADVFTTEAEARAWLLDPNAK
jgi:hypothetical protein